MIYYKYPQFLERSQDGIPTNGQAFFPNEDIELGDVDD